MPGIAGAILAGGSALRLGGIAKGTLRVCGGPTIVDRLVLELRRAGVADIVIVANDPAPYADCGLEIVGDIRAGMGPLGGIEAAITHLAQRSDAVLFLPCDVPAIGADQIAALMRASGSSMAPVVYAQTGVSLCHPLCAVVHNASLPQIAVALDDGRRKVQDLWRQIGAVAVEFADSEPFLNINSPQELDRWRDMQKQ